MAVGKEEILKARTDTREYRRIVLPNSLQVLLISDPDTDKAITHFTSTFLCIYVFIQKFTIFGFCAYISLFKCLIFVFFFIFQCAASMDVSVGSFSDPDGLEGLAHFLGNLYSFLFYFLLLFFVLVFGYILLVQLLCLCMHVYVFLFCITNFNTCKPFWCL